MLEKSKIDIENDFTEEEVAAIAPKPLPKEEQIAKKYQAGLPVLQIAKEHNISTGKIYNILNRKGVKLRNGRTLKSQSASRLITMTAVQKQNLINDYLDGMMLKTIFDKYDINKHGTYAILDEQNVPRRDDPSLHTGHHYNNSRNRAARKAYKSHAKAAAEAEDVSYYIEDGTLCITISKKRIMPVENIQISFEL